MKDGTTPTKPTPPCDFIGCDEFAIEVFCNKDKSRIMLVCGQCAADIHHDIETQFVDICTQEPMFYIGEVA